MLLVGKFELNCDFILFKNQMQSEWTRLMSSAVQILSAKSQLQHKFVPLRINNLCPYLWMVFIVFIAKSLAILSQWFIFKLWFKYQNTLHLSAILYGNGHTWTDSLIQNLIHKQCSFAFNLDKYKNCSYLRLQTYADFISMAKWLQNRKLHI